MSLKTLNVYMSTNVCEEKDESDRKKVTSELEFTGNWFIDAGILGFVNLMEEVYGWNLEKLREKIQNEQEVVYYGYFPFAYFYKLCLDSLIKEKKEGLDSLIKEKEEVKEAVINFIEANKDKGKNLLDEIWWTYITKLFHEIWVDKQLNKIYNKIFDKTKRASNQKNKYPEEIYELIEKIEKALNELVNEHKEELSKLFREKKVLKKNSKHNLDLKDIIIEYIKKQEKLSDACSKKIEEVLELLNDLRERLDNMWKHLMQSKDRQHIKSSFYRIPVDSSFYKNFLFFNIGRNISDQLEDLKSLIKGDVKYSDYLSKIDKTVNKFLPSDEEFPNVSYTEFRVERLLKEKRFLFVYLLNFLNSFNSISSVGNYFFYTPDLEFTYKINKELKLKLKKISSESQKSRSDILKVTWESILDYIYETESVWVLENMFIVCYKRVANQEIIDVEYMEISKLQASFILDENLRKNLNYHIKVHNLDENLRKNLNYHIKVHKRDYWLIEEFIRNKPLLPIILHYIHLRLNEKDTKTPKYGKQKLLYPVLIDAKISEMSRGDEKRIFNDSFFDRFRMVVEEVKKDFGKANSISKSFSSLFDNDEAEKYARTLFEFVRRSRKDCFANLMLRILNKKIENTDEFRTILNITKYLFENVLNNDISWRNYAVVFIVALLDGVEGGESDGDLESENE